MNLKNRTILITGGSEGIGLSLAAQLVEHNQVIICSRNSQKLQAAKAKYPHLQTYQCDITDNRQRWEMVNWLSSTVPQLDILINNAGGKQVTQLLDLSNADRAMELDVTLNFSAPASLCQALLPILSKQKNASIVNVTSGLVYLPKAEQTFYCAAKTALHSYTRCLRWALRHSSVSVHEVMMTLVDTNFHLGDLPKNIKAVSAERAAKDMLKALKCNRTEIRLGKSAYARWFSAFLPYRSMFLVNG